MFFKIGVLKNFANLKGKHLPWSFFLIKLQAQWPPTLSKTDPNTGVKNTSFYSTPPVAASENNEQQQLFEGFANSC